MLSRQALSVGSPKCANLPSIQPLVHPQLANLPSIFNSVSSFGDIRVPLTCFEKSKVIDKKLIGNFLSSVTTPTRHKS